MPNSKELVKITLKNLDLELKLLNKKVEEADQNIIAVAESHNSLVNLVYTMRDALILISEKGIFTYEEVTEKTEKRLRENGGDHSDGSTGEGEEDPVQPKDAGDHEGSGGSSES